MKKYVFLLVSIISCFVLFGCGNKLEGIKIEGEQNLIVDDKTVLELKTNPENFQIQNIKWTSDDENVASVENGVVTGKSVGLATITVDAGDGITDFIIIKVYPHTESITFNDKELKLSPNEEKTINISVVPEKVYYTLESDNDEVITISEEGVIKAIGYGKAKILAKTKDNKEAICNVTVSTTIPDFGSMSKNEATNWGSENLVAIKTSTDYSDSVRSGGVIKQSIEAGTSLEETGKTIEIVYSLGHKETLGEKNALSKAKSYLSVMAFSAEGLKEQLEFEGFSSDEAEYGVDNCGANWNEQAAKKAKEYLNVMSFSRKSLKEQLLFEGFTDSEAEYGVESVGY